MGALTNWNARELTLDLSFLGPGRYEAVILRDAVNADRDATDYVREVVPVAAGDKLTLKVSNGSG